MRTRTFAFLISISILFLAACSKNSSNNTDLNPDTSATSVAFGQWGGQGIQMMIANNGTVYQLDCAHGTIDQAIVPDNHGIFHNTGTIYKEGGPTHIPPTPAIPAIFDGKESDDGGGDSEGTMTLVISWHENDQILSSTFILHEGTLGRIIRCL